MPVELPAQNPKKLLAYKLFHAVISQVPLVGGPYAAMLSVTHPPKIEELHAKWQNEVTEAVNNMETIVDQLVGAIPISDLATAIGIWISKNSKTGRRDPVDFAPLLMAFSDFSKLQIEDALGELEYAGLVTNSGDLGHKIIRARPTVKLFEVFDPVVFEEANPRADAAQAARYIITGDQTVGAEAIMKHFGWNIRRLNPAIAIVCTMIGDGRKSREINSTLECRFVMPNSKERAALKHFANIVLGPD